MCPTNVAVIAWHYRKNVVHEAFYHIGPVAEVSFCDKNKSARGSGEAVWIPFGKDSISLIKCFSRL